MKDQSKNTNFKKIICFFLKDDLASEYEKKT